MAREKEMIIMLRAVEFLLSFGCVTHFYIRFFIQH